MRNTILIVLISLLIVSCNKNKFTVIPQLKFKSVNTSKLYNGQVIVFKLSFTDGDGDLSDSMYVEKVSPNCPAGSFQQKYPLPVFPSVKDSQGDLDISFSYGVVQGYPPLSGPMCGVNDTCYFRFMLKDKAQHTSDTVNSGQIILYQ